MNYLPKTTAALTSGHLRTLAQALRPLATEPQVRLGGVSFRCQSPARKFYGPYARELVSQDAAGRRALSVLTDEVTRVMQTDGRVGNAQYAAAVPVLVSSTNLTGMKSDQKSWPGVAFHFEVGALTCVVPILTTPLTVEPDAVQAVRMRQFLPTSSDADRLAALAQLRISPDNHRVLGVLPMPRPQCSDSDPVSLRYLFDITRGQGAARLFSRGAASVVDRGESMFFERFLAGPPARVADDIEVVLSSHPQTPPALLTAKAVSAALCWSGLQCTHLCTSNVRIDGSADTPRLVPLAQGRPHFLETWKSIRDRFEHARRSLPNVFWSPHARFRIPYDVHLWKESFMSGGSDNAHQWLQEEPVLNAFAAWWGAADRNAMASILRDEHENPSGF